MTEQQLKIEHKHCYETRLGCLEVFDRPPTAQEHNMAVIEADLHVAKLRKQNSVVSKLKEFAESL